jgi:superfamily II DNA or RNA helicase
MPPGKQTLVFVDHIEDHLVSLHKEMPTGTRFVHRGESKAELGKFALTPKQQREVSKDFQANKFQFLLATDAFRSGVDIPNCRVVIQASGGSSEIEVLQEAFRGARLLPEALQEELRAEDKTHMVLIDFLDQHDPALENMSYKRMEIYRKQGWEIHEVDTPEEIDWERFLPTIQPKKKK